MSDPVPYTVTYSFGAHTGQISAAQLDNQFDAIAAASSQAVTALQDIRRSDGQLKNGIVTLDSLAPSLIADIAAALNV